MYFHLYSLSFFLSLNLIDSATRSNNFVDSVEDNSFNSLSSHQFQSHSKFKITEHVQDATHRFVEYLLKDRSARTRTMLLHTTLLFPLRRLWSIIRKIRSISVWHYFDIPWNDFNPFDPCDHASLLVHSIHLLRPFDAPLDRNIPVDTNQEASHDIRWATNLQNIGNTVYSQWNNERRRVKNETVKSISRHGDEVNLGDVETFQGVLRGQVLRSFRLQASVSIVWNSAVSACCYYATWLRTIHGTLFSFEPCCFNFLEEAIVRLAD